MIRYCTAVARTNKGCANIASNSSRALVHTKLYTSIIFLVFDFGWTSCRVPPVTPQLFCRVCVDYHVPPVAHLFFWVYGVCNLLMPRAVVRTFCKRTIRDHYEYLALALLSLSFTRKSTTRLPPTAVEVRVCACV